MERRDFLIQGLTAIVTTAIAYSVGKSTFRVGGADEPETELTPELTREEQEDIAVSKLMDKYQIPDFEKAKELHARIINETSIYYAGGALSGSIFRSTNNELSPQSRRKFFHRAVNVVAGSGLALVSSYPAKWVEQTLHKKNLTKPETLVDEYGMPADQAEEFSENYNKVLTNKAQSGALSAVLLQEIFIGPPKDKPSLDAPENHA